MDKIQDISAIDFKKSLPSRGALLGIDYGDVRIGVALSDTSRMIASPFETLAHVSEFAPLIQENKIVGFVIGLPKQMDGTEGQQALKTRAFAKKMVEVYGLPVLFWDERFSSSCAEQIFNATGISHKKQKKVIDKTAACYILQGALDLMKNFS